MTHFVWTRGAAPQLSPHFHGREFECRCGSCGPQKISKELISLLEDVRISLGVPISVTSGYRCDFYQQILAGEGLQTAKNSQHTLGNAADITATKFSELLPLLEQRFDAIGLARNFYHVDIRRDKKRRWIYK